MVIARQATEWFYANGNQQVGPMSEEELRALVDGGTLSGKTLVWREGLAEWSAAETVFAPQGVAMVPLVVCAECGRSLPSAAALQIQGVSVCERCKTRAVQKVMEGVTLGSLATVKAWRDGRYVLTNDGCHLTSACVKCNSPATSSLKRKLQWHSPWVYLTLLLNLLVYAIVAMITRKRAVIHIGLCDAHRKRRKIDITIMWTAFLLGLGASIFGFTHDRPEMGVFGLVGALVGLVYGIMRMNIVTAQRIHPDGRVLLRGVCKSFRESLPSV